jgi:hypothetical protein
MARSLRLSPAALLLVLLLPHCLGAPTGGEDGVHATGKTNRISDGVSMGDAEPEVSVLESLFVQVGREFAGSLCRVE